MQTALVAGGAGFIGSHLVKHLLTKDFNIICVDNLITGSLKNIEDIKDNPKLFFLKQDISKGVEIPNIDRVDFVFHLASPASPNKKSKNSYMSYPVETLLVNSYGTYNLLEFSRKYKSKFLFASTSEIYGDPLVSPQKEDYFGNVNPVGVRAVYDEAKRFGEAITMAYFRKYLLNTRIARIFNTFGPFMQPDDGRVVSNFVNQAIKNEPITIYGTGEQTRSFCYIDDMVLGIGKAMFDRDTIGNVINLGNPDERSIKELADVIKKLIGSSSSIVYEELPKDDPKTRCPDISKAKKLLDWEPSVTLEGGLKKTIDYFKSI